VEELDARMPRKGTIHDIDAQRARWLRYRTSQRLTIEAGEDFALGGLGRYVDGLDLRLAFLPEDPDADGVTLDSDTLDWLKEQRPTPYGGPSPQWGTGTGRPALPWSCTTSIGTMPVGCGAWRYIVTEASSSAAATSPTR
jgi:hypothetical protein